MRLLILTERLHVLDLVVLGGLFVEIFIWLSHVKA